MKTIIISFILCAAFFSAVAQSTAYRDYHLTEYPVVTKADSAWKDRPKGKSKFNELRSPVIDLINPSPQDKLYENFFHVGMGVIQSAEILKIRKWGVDFWKKFPEDKRRFAWLRATMSGPVTYWENNWEGIEDRLSIQFTAPLDLEKKEAWDKQYSLFRDEMLDAVDVPESEKQELIFLELRNELRDIRYPQVRILRNGFNYKDWAKKLISYADYYYKNVYRKNALTLDNVVSMSFFAFEWPTALGMNDEKQEDFLKILANCNVRELAKYANDRLALFYLRKKPFELRDHTYTGQPIDLKKMQKKAILIDFWSIGCSGCIAAMPGIKKVYDKYKDRGFEVISIDISGPERRDKIIEIHKKVGADWPLITMEKASWQKIFNSYNWIGVPKMLLLGPDKKLIMYNDELHDHHKMDLLVERTINKD